MLSLVLNRPFKFTHKLSSIQLQVNKMNNTTENFAVPCEECEWYEKDSEDRKVCGKFFNPHRECSLKEYAAYVYSVDYERFVMPNDFMSNEIKEIIQIESEQSI